MKNQCQQCGILIDGGIDACMSEDEKKEIDPMFIEEF